MKTLTLYFALILGVFFNSLNAQESFETRAKTIAQTIEKITKDEKTALKAEVDAVNGQLEKNIITSQQADEMKIKLAESRAKNIEKLVAAEQEKLTALVQEKVDGKIKEVVGDDKKYELSLNWKKTKNDSIKNRAGESRTTSQFVFAAGLNNVVTNSSVNDSDFRYFGSHFYEWGITYNTRLSKTDNLLHAKYGFSVMYNNLRPTNNRSFVVAGNQTNLQTSTINFDDSRLKNVYLVFPLHLEFDFTKKSTMNNKPYFISHKSFRFGIGGYAGMNLKTKQYTEYSANGYDTEQMTNGDFNTSNFIYGLSTYIGYRETSLYLKYDMNPLFTNNVVKQNNISLGVRFDFN